jgi:exosortase/archaeosortase family protein
MFSFVKQPLVLFLLKAVILWLVWMLLYGIVFKKDEINDPVTRIEANITAQVFKIMGYDVSLSNNHVVSYKNLDGEDQIVHNKQYILIDGKPIIGIATACNGVELFAMFIGFLIAFGGRKKLIPFFILGLFSIFLLNTFRIVVITWISMFNREQAEFHHHYSFMFLVYGYILWLWYKWTVIQELKKSNESKN